MNVDSRRCLKPGPVGDQRPIGTALREMVDGRYDRIPDELEQLLKRLDLRAGKGAA